MHNLKFYVNQLAPAADVAHALQAASTSREELLLLGQLPPLSSHLAATVMEMMLMVVL